MTRYAAQTEVSTDKIPEVPWWRIMLSKFPDFDMNWGPHDQSKWFEAFDKIIGILVKHLKEEEKR